MSDGICAERLDPVFVGVSPFLAIEPEFLGYRLRILSLAKLYQVIFTRWIIWTRAVSTCRSGHLFLIDNFDMFALYILNGLYTLAINKFFILMGDILIRIGLCILVFIGSHWPEIFLVVSAAQFQVENVIYISFFYQGSIRFQIDTINSNSNFIGTC